MHMPLVVDYRNLSLKVWHWRLEWSEEGCVIEENAGVTSGVEVEGWGDGDSDNEGAALDVGESDETEEIVEVR